MHVALLQECVIYTLQYYMTTCDVDKDVDATLDPHPFAFFFASFFASYPHKELAFCPATVT